MATTPKYVLALLGLGFSLFGCSAQDSQTGTSVESSSVTTSSLEQDCARYLTAYASNNIYGALVEEYNTKFPFLDDSGFKEKLYVWDFSTGTAEDYDQAIHEAQKSYLVGDRPLPKSLKHRIMKVEPFTDAEKGWLSERTLWENKLSLARLRTTHSDQLAAALWPLIQDEDLKGVLKQIADLDSTEESGDIRTQAFIAGDTICSVRPPS